MTEKELEIIKNSLKLTKILAEKTEGLGILLPGDLDCIDVIISKLDRLRNK